MGKVKNSAVQMHRGSFLKEVKRDWQLLLLLLLPITQIFIFLYLPIYGITIAFRDYFIGDPYFAWGEAAKWIGIKNFLKFFSSIYFQKTMINTLLLNVYSLVFTFWIPIAFALLLNEIRHVYYKKFVQTVSYLPYFISTVVVVSMVFALLGNNGLVNNIIELLGKDKIQFLSKAEYFRTIFISMNTWRSFGWNAIIYLSAITSIDQEQYQAARIDGANRWQQNVHITLPGITPTIIIILILNMGGLFSSATQTLLLFTDPGVNSVAEVVGTYSYRMGIKGAQYSYSTAIGFFITVINFLMLAITNKISRTFSENSLW